MGHQVPRMGHIYSKAETTISWLGCNNSSWISLSDGLPGPSIDMEEDIRLITEKVASNGVAVKRFFAQPRLLHWTDVTKLLLWTDKALNALNSSKWTCLHERKGLPDAISEVVQLGSGTMTQRIVNILSLPYWTRVWITQEVALGKEAILMFGGVSLDLDDFLLTYKSYCYYMSKACSSKRVELRVPMEARAAVHENDVSFQQVLQWGQHCKASKYVDRIYGLLGLLERCGDGTDTLPSILAEPIDYERDWREVYWEIVLTYHPRPDSSITFGSGDNGTGVTSWMHFLPQLGQSLSCPFTRESLQCADNERATPLCRKNARIALNVVDICRQAAMTDIDIIICEPDASDVHIYDGPSLSPTTPTSLSEIKLWKQHLVRHSVNPFPDIQLLLGTLLITSAGTQDMERNDEYQAALIGLRISRSERREGAWNCVERSMRGPLGHSINVKCELRMPCSQLPCSSHTTTPSASSLPKSHRCRTSDRYLVIEKIGWVLILRSFNYVREKACWRGRLHIEY